MPALTPTELAVDLAGPGRPAGLVLRPWRDADVALLTELCQDPDIQRWTMVPSPYARRDALEFVARSQASWRDGRAANFAVCDAATDAVLGSTALRPSLDHPHQAEIGYWCGATARGRGVTTAAGRTLCAWAFTQLGLARITWHADRGNEASWRVAHQIGFRFEGVTRAALPDGRGAFADAWTGGLLAGEVRSERAPLPFGPDPVLRDGPVLVRRWREADIDAYVALRGERSVREWDGAYGIEPANRTNAYERLCVSDVEGWLLGTRAALAVQVNGEVAGHVAVHRTHERLAEVGWWLGSAYRGRGYAARAVALIGAWAASIGLERLEARIHAANGPSQALAARVGFVREGRLSADAPRHGRWEDGFLYALLP